MKLLIKICIITILTCLARTHCQADDFVTKNYFYNFNNITKLLCIRDITQSNGMIWLATEGGLYSFDGYHLIRRPFMTGGREYRGAGIYNRIINEGDSLVIECSNATLSFNLATYTFRLINNEKKDEAAQGSGFLMHTTARLNIGNDWWIGSARQLQHYSGGKLVKTYDMPVVKSLCYTGDKLKKILVGTDNGLFVIDQAGEVMHILHDARRSTSLAGDAVWCIYLHDNNIWVGTNNGLSLISDDINLRYTLPDITGLSIGNQITTVYVDSKKRLWLGGINGLLCIDDYMANIQNGFRWYKMNDPVYPIPHNRIRVITETAEGDILVGGDGGLLLLDENTSKFVRMNLNDDRNNWIYDIQPQKNGMLNITTHEATYNAFIDRDSKTLKTTKKLPRQHVMSQSQIMLNEFVGTSSYISAFKDPHTGNIILGGTDCIAIYKNRNLQDSRTATANLVITDVISNDTLMTDHADITNNTIELPTETRFVEILFTDFRYSPNLPVSYEYTIDGKTWLPLRSSDNTLLLNNISHGEYDICIRSAKNHNSSVSFSLRILPPWYATWWAICGYAFVTFIIGFGIWKIIQQRKRIIMARHKQQELILTAKQNEERLNEEKEQLAEEKELLSTQLRIHLQDQVGNDDALISEDEKLLRHITKVIEDNIGNSDLNVEVLSEMCGIHKKQIYRKIKDMTGLTTVAYIRDLRLKKAAAMIAKGGFTITEVMYHVGFSNPSYFSHCFMEAFGVPPKDYKANTPNSQTTK